MPGPLGSVGNAMRRRFGEPFPHAQLMDLHIVPARSPADWNTARRLVEAYVASLPVELDFQSIDEELDELSRHYSPPEGAFLLAEHAGRWVGCIGLRRFAQDVCEMKRLYVDPGARGLGAGRALAEGVIAAARAAGYRRMVLDTLPSMGQARALYASLGFRPIPAYRYNPVPGTAFLELPL